MSICLGITKGIAVSSLGLLAGILTTGTICIYSTPVEVLTLELRSAICKIGETASLLGVVSTGFFALSYFGVPPHMRHPYLIYSALVAPVSALYLWGISRCSHKCHAQKKALDEEAQVPPQDKSQDLSPSLSDSMVDLGAEKLPQGHPPVKEGAKCPLGSATVTNSPATADHARTPGCQSKLAKHLAVVTFLTVVGFVQSVIGVYGEPI